MCDAPAILTHWDEIQHWIGMASHDSPLSFAVFPLFTRRDENVVPSFVKVVARKQLSSVDLISKAFVPDSHSLFS